MAQVSGVTRKALSKEDIFHEESFSALGRCLELGGLVGSVRPCRRDVSGGDVEDGADHRPVLLPGLSPRGGRGPVLHQPGGPEDRASGGEPGDVRHDPGPRHPLRVSGTAGGARGRAVQQVLGPRRRQGRTGEERCRPEGQADRLCPGHHARDPASGGADPQRALPGYGRRADARGLLRHGHGPVPRVDRRLPLREAVQMHAKL